MRKVKIICMCLILCLTLSGCGITNAIRESMGEKNTSKALEDVASNTVSRATQQAADAVAKAQAAKADAQAKFNNAFSFPIIPKAWQHPFLYKDCKSAAISLQQANIKLKTIASQDKVLAASKQEKKDKDFKEKILPIILIAAGVIVLIIFIILMMKRQPKITAKVSSVPVQDEAPRVKADVSYYDIDYETKLKELCAQKGLDYETTLAEYNDNTMRAFNALYVR